MRSGHRDRGCALRLQLHLRPLEADEYNSVEGVLIVSVSHTDNEELGIEPLTVPEGRQWSTTGVLDLPRKKTKLVSPAKTIESAKLSSMAPCRGAQKSASPSTPGKLMSIDGPRN
jgi:hypothetical protein